MSLELPKDLELRAASNGQCRAIIELVSAVLGEFDLYLELDGPDRDLLDIEGHCHERGGVVDLVLETASVLETAIALYRSYGFKRYDGEVKCGQCHETYRLDLAATPAR